MTAIVCRWSLFLPQQISKLLGCCLSCNHVGNNVMMMMILHLFQPHQADQMLDPDRIFCMQALPNLATPIRSSCHMKACIVCCPWNK